MKVLTTEVESILDGKTIELVKEKNKILKEEQEINKNNITSSLNENYSNVPMTADRMVHEVSEVLPENAIICL